MSNREVLAFGNEDFVSTLSYGAVDVLTIDREMAAQVSRSNVLY